MVTIAWVWFVTDIKMFFIERNVFTTSRYLTNGDPWHPSACLPIHNSSLEMTLASRKPRISKTSKRSIGVFWFYGEYMG